MTILNMQRLDLGLVSEGALTGLAHAGDDRADRNQGEEVQ